MKLMDVVGLFLRRAMEGEDWDEAEEEVVESMLFQGYDANEINTAVSVVHRLRDQLEHGHFLKGPVESNRVFQALEEIRLTTEARGYLLQLLHDGVISTLQREEIIEKTFLIDSPEINLEDVRYVANAVLSGEDFGFDEDEDMDMGWYH